MALGFISQLNRIIYMNEQIGRWAFIIGTIISVIAGFIEIGLTGLGILVVLGIIVGFVNITSKEISDFLLATIALMLVGTVGLNIPYIGELVTNILSAFISFVAGAALVVALKEALTISRGK
jgi:hypothetical protein